MNNQEIRTIINKLLDQIDDERILRAIYRFINELFCKS